jgi:hypothetical protein
MGSRAMTGRQRRFGVWLAGAGVLCAAPVTGAEPAAVLGGRLVFRDRGRELQVAELGARPAPLTLELRQDWRVLEAPIDQRGVFAVSGPPGLYRIEYLRLGDLVEFVLPHEVEVRPGAVTCLGTLELALDDPPRNFGGNASRGLTIRDGCPELGPELLARGGAAGPVVPSLARPAGPEPRSRSLLDVLVDVRLELGLLGLADLPELRASFVHRLWQADGGGGPLIGAALSRFGGAYIDRRWPPAVGEEPAPPRWGASLTAGYAFWYLEAQGSGGFVAGQGRGPQGAVGGLALRLGTFLLGFGGRVQWFAPTGDGIALFTFDFSPVGAVGALL